MPVHRKTRRSFDVPGDSHFLTFSCFRRLPLLSSDRSRGWMINAIRQSQNRRLFDLWAFVVMPEHVHLVLLPLEKTPVAGILSALKQSVSKRAILWLKQNAPAYLENLLDRQPNGDAHHRFWQRGGGYDRNLRSVHEIYEKVSYVHQNPVRRGLVATATEWRWSSAAAWKEGIDVPLRIDRVSLPTLTVLDEGVGGGLMIGDV